MKKILYRALFTREAKKNIEKLDPSIRNIIKNAIESLTLNPFKGKLLSYELAGLRSLRTSDYRIIYRVREKELLIIMVTVGHRKDIYKKLAELLDFLKKTDFKTLKREHWEVPAARRAIVEKEQGPARQDLMNPGPILAAMGKRTGAKR